MKKEDRQSLAADIGNLPHSDITIMLPNGELYFIEDYYHQSTLLGNTVLVLLAGEKLDKDPVVFGVF